MSAKDRRPDWRSAEFWQWAEGACDARPRNLALWFPEVNAETWARRKRCVTSVYTCRPATRKPVDYGPEPPDGWPSRGVEDGANRPVKLEAEIPIEERIERDATVRRLKAENADLKAKYAEAHEDAEIEHRLIAAIESRYNSLPPVPAPTFRPRNPGRPESVVALMSDAHIGEVVNFEETGGLNAYDFDTFSSRYQYLIDGIGGVCFGKLTGYDFPEIVVCALGDMVSGIIHDELVETSDGTLMDWLIDGSHIIAQGLRQLACEFPSVRVEWHFGNHGRVTQKPRYKRRWVNYDYLLGHMVATELKDQPNVTFANHKSFWSLTEIQGRYVLNLHGDNIRGWGGIPLYGVQRAVANLSALLNAQRRSFEVVNLGHFHQTALLERVDCDVILNGSMIGGNEYSYGALFAGSKPRQVIYGMHPERGRTWQYALDLSNGDTHECRFTK